MDVKPWVVDVTDAFSLDDFTTDKEVYVNYNTNMFYNGSWVPPLSSSASGYIIMSSNLIFYTNTTTNSSTSDDKYTDDITAFPSYAPTHSPTYSPTSSLYINVDSFTFGIGVLIGIVISIFLVYIISYVIKSTSDGHGQYNLVANQEPPPPENNIESNESENRSILQFSNHIIPISAVDTDTSPLFSTYE